MTVWQLLARLGHRGDRDAIIQHVFEAASRVTFRSEDGGEPVDGGDFLVETFEALGTTEDWPPSGSRQWTRLREVAVRRILARLAREGLLDAVAVGGDRGATAPDGTDARARQAGRAEGGGAG
jgi:hypothetical protein